ncbi:MAG: hypothetical protein WBS20_00110 [Lysobacterales bacterium]
MRSTKMILGVTLATLLSWCCCNAQNFPGGYWSVGQVTAVL